MNVANFFCPASPRVFPVALASTLLTGCSSNFGSLTAPEPVQNSLAGITGSGHGGEQPISGATINVYAAGTDRYGGASVPLSPTPVVSNLAGYAGDGVELIAVGIRP